MPEGRKVITSADPFSSASGAGSAGKAVPSRPLTREEEQEVYEAMMEIELELQPGG